MEQANMTTPLTALITVIGAPIGAYILYLLKSIVGQNVLSRLENKIKFCKENNIDIHELLSEQYQVKTFAQEFGFEIVFNKLKPYISLYKKCNISPRSFKYLYKQNLIKYSEEANEATIEITKFNKFSYRSNWVFIIILLAISLVCFYFGDIANELTTSQRIHVLILLVSIISSIICYFSALYQIIKYILPYQEAKRLVRKLKED